MTVFATMHTTLAADVNMGSDAYYRRPPYVWQSCRVILSQPTDALGNARAGTMQADVAASAITDTPQRNDEVKIGADTYTVEDAERDPLALSWRLTLSSAVAD